MSAEVNRLLHKTFVTPIDHEQIRGLINAMDDVLEIAAEVVDLGRLAVLDIAFDFLNGFHDAANSIATVVSTGVSKPHQALAFAAFFNFIAIFAFQSTVVATLDTGIVMPGAVDRYVVFGALIGAIVWKTAT